MIAWFARNPVAANLLMGFIIVSGGIAAVQINSEVFPELRSTRSVSRSPTSAPRRRSRGRRLRADRGSDPGYRRHQADHILGVRGQWPGHDRARAWRRQPTRRRRRQESRRRDYDVPVETEKPIIRELVARTQVVDIAVSGRAGEFTLKAIAERIRDELSAIPEISLVEIATCAPTRSPSRSRRWRFAGTA